MGRETRQQRRARERRELQQRRRKQSSLRDRWPLLAGAGAVLVVLALVAGIAVAKNSTTNSSSLNLTPVPAKTIDRIDCNFNEVLGAYHQHAHLNIIINGKSVAIPAGVGNKENTDHECMYWMHTHGPPSLGVIHMEAPHTIRPTLGAFFDVWNQPLSAQRVWKYALKPGQEMRVYVNQKPYTGNVRSIVLIRHTDVTLEIGPPFVAPPKPFNFAKYQL